MECIVCIKTVHQKKDEYMQNTYKYLVLFIYTFVILSFMKIIAVRTAS